MQTEELTGDSRICWGPLRVSQQELTTLQICVHYAGVGDFGGAGGQFTKCH